MARVELSLEELAGYIERRFNEVLDAGVNEADKRCKENTPIQYGYLMNSWMMGENTHQGKPERAGRLHPNVESRFRTRSTAPPIAFTPDKAQGSKAYLPDISEIARDAGTLHERRNLIPDALGLSRHDSLVEGIASFGESTVGLNAPTSGQARQVEPHIGMGDLYSEKRRKDKARKAERRRRFAALSDKEKLELITETKKQHREYQADRRRRYAALPDKWKREFGYRLLEDRPHGTSPMSKGDINMGTVREAAWRENPEGMAMAWSQGQRMTESEMISEMTLGYFGRNIPKHNRINYKRARAGNVYYVFNNAEYAEPIFTGTNLPPGWLKIKYSYLKGGAARGNGYVPFTVAKEVAAYINALTARIGRVWNPVAPVQGELFLDKSYAGPGTKGPGGRLRDFDHPRADLSSPLSLGESRFIDSGYGTIKGGREPGDIPLLSDIFDVEPVDVGDLIDHSGEAFGFDLEDIDIRGPVRDPNAFKPRRRL